MSSAASRLRSHRAELGWTQGELAQKLSVSRSAVAQWENDEGSLPSTASFMKLAVVLGCSFEWLATGQGTRESGTAAPEDSAAAAVDLRYFARSDAEEQMISAFRVLVESDQKLVGSLLSSMQDKTRMARRRDY